MTSKSRKRFLCVDCDVDTEKIKEFYFVHTSLWLVVTPSVDGMLCIGCLEKRLGRQLVKSDFADVFINDPRSLGGKSERLLSRLLAT